MNPVKQFDSQQNKAPRPESTTFNDEELQQKQISKQEINETNNNFQSKQDEHYSFKYQKTQYFQSNVPHWKLPIYQRFKIIPLENSLELSFIVQKILYTSCSNGHLAMLKENFISDLTSATKLKSNTPKSVGSLLSQAETAGLIYLTTNPFNENEIHVSLCLCTITIQSLSWILNSLKLDCLTPSEKMIQSRLKQYFGLKIDQKEWEKVMNCIKHSKFYCNDEANWKIRKSLADFESDLLFKFTIPKLAVKLMKDPLVKADVHILYLLNQPWPCEDNQVVDKENLNWNLFLKFMNEYFDKQPNENEGIQGGRYWCAQFVKAYGPIELKKCSLGKLNLYVQEAINCGILKYFKTQILRNETYSHQEKQAQVQNGQEQKQFKIKLIQQAIVQILQENSFGVVLSSLPQLIKKRVPFFTNFQDLGFQKLKDFLLLMKDQIIIEMPNSNSSYVILNINGQQAQKSQPNATIQPTQQPQSVAIQPTQQLQNVTMQPTQQLQTVAIQSNQQLQNTVMQPTQQLQNVVKLKRNSLNQDQKQFEGYQNQLTQFANNQFSYNYQQPQQQNFINHEQKLDQQSMFLKNFCEVQQYPVQANYFMFTPQTNQETQQVNYYTSNDVRNNNQFGNFSSYNQGEQNLNFLQSQPNNNALSSYFHENKGIASLFSNEQHLQQMGYNENLENTLLAQQVLSLLN